VARDFADLEEKVQWCESNTEACLKMIDGRHQVVRFLTNDDAQTKTFRQVIQQYNAFYAAWAGHSRSEAPPTLAIAAQNEVFRQSGGRFRQLITAAINLFPRRDTSTAQHVAHETALPFEAEQPHVPVDSPAIEPETEFHELQNFSRRVPRLQFRTVFDVGANIGQSAQMFRRLWPDAQIYAFEPVSTTLTRLRSKFKDEPAVHCFGLALGDEQRRVTIESEPMRKMNRIRPNGARPGRRTEEVDLQTGDAFCRSLGIDTIDFLKIDAEGFDLKICKGFEQMLLVQRIAALQIEVGLQYEDPVHLPLHDFLSYLHPLGYRLFKIHNQYIRTDRPMARRGNAVFLSLAQVKENGTERIEDASRR